MRKHMKKSYFSRHYFHIVTAFLLNIDEYLYINNKTKELSPKVKQILPCVSSILQVIKQS
jgi:hypothetical protein